jgi:hypothetical protein
MHTAVYEPDVAAPPPAPAVDITLDQQGLTFERFEQLIAMLNRGATVTVHNPARARTSTLELGFRLMSWYERVKNSV